MNNKTFFLSLAVLVVVIIAIIFGSRFLQRKEIIVTGGAGMFNITPVDWTNPKTPMKSPPLKDNEIPKGAVEIKVSAEGFVPNNFKVNQKEEIVLTLESSDQWSHSIDFSLSEGLEKVIVGVEPDAVRAITFNVPDEKGEYPFFCNLPGHRARGEWGNMIVK